MARAKVTTDGRTTYVAIQGTATQRKNITATQRKAIDKALHTLGEKVARRRNLRIIDRTGTMPYLVAITILGDILSGTATQEQVKELRDILREL